MTTKEYVNYLQDLDSTDGAEINWFAVYEFINNKVIDKMKELAEYHNEHYDYECMWDGEVEEFVKLDNDVTIMK